MEGIIDEYASIKGTYYENDTDIKIDGKKAKIPGGATISGIEGEYESINDGLVIYMTNGDIITDWNLDSNSNGIKDVQEKYDQFVWIPVEKPLLDLSSNLSAFANDSSIKDEVQKEIDEGRYPMAIKKDEDTYIGVLYEFSEETTEENQERVKVELYSNWKPTSTNSGRREPDIVSDYDNQETYLTQINEILGTEYISATEFKSDLQKDFKNMVIRVEENGGFWVGRYETSKMNTSQISVVRGTQEGINDTDWYNMYAKQKKYSNQKSLDTMNSSMIWGSQWDQIMLWMKNVKNTVNQTNGHYYVTNAIGMGNYGTDDDEHSDVVNTGFYEVKNVFDLAGNVYDWILEASNTGTRIHRRRML